MAIDEEKVDERLSITDLDLLSSKLEIAVKKAKKARSSRYSPRKRLVFGSFCRVCGGNNLSMKT
jgi:hypothetical protein